MAKVAKKVAYVIVEISWEYNDEYYYTTESDAGQPAGVFLDKEKAEQKCLELNKNAIKTCELGSHLVDGWLDPALLEKLQEIDPNISGEDNYDFSLPENLTDEQLTRATKVLGDHGISFYRIEETELSE